MPRRRHHKFHEPRPRAALTHRRPLRFEPLEDRRLLATFTVDTVLDVVDKNDGFTSLREAIALANVNSDADTIDFAPALMASGPTTIVLAHGQFGVTRPLTINGPTTNALTIDAQQLSRILNIDDPSISNENFDVTLRNLTLTRGRTVGDNIINSGGAVRSLTQGKLTIENCVVRANATTGSGANGGAIYSARELEIRGSSIVENTTAGQGSRGGGIYGNTNIAIVGSTIHGNSTAGRFAHGGGIAGGHVTVTATEVSANRTLGLNAHGGGVFGLGVTLFDSTVSGNSTAGEMSDGGGVVDIAGGGITLIRSTVTNNHALSATSEGGGLRTIEGPMILNGSIVAGNTAGEGSPDLRVANSVTASYSLVGDTSGLTANQLASVTDGIGNVLNQPAKLGPLAANGGPTMTHALLVGSPAIDAGDPAAEAGMNGVPEFDQRGTPFGRVVDGDTAGGPRIDMGAHERQAGEVFHLVVDTLVDEDDGSYSPGDFSLREALAIANANLGTDTISFAPALTATGPATILLEHGELKVTDSVTVNGPGARLLTIDASGNDPTPDSTLDDGISNNDGDGSCIFNIDDADSAKLTNVTLVGLRLTGGDTSFGGAIRFFHRDESLTLHDVIVEGNSGGNFGGGILVHPAMGVVSSSARLTITDSTIRNNAVSAYGGGVYTYLASATITNSLIENNRTLTRADLGAGAGIHLAGGAPHSLTIQQSTIRGNSAPHNSGGGVRVLRISSDPIDSPDLTITDSSIVENSAWVGGGISATGVTAKISGSTIAYNTASYFTLGGSTDVRGLGGGLAITNNSTLEIVGTTISHNSAIGNMARGEGGGIYLAIPSAFISHSTIAHNTATQEGGGIYINGSGTLTLDHSIVARNDALLWQDIEFGTVQRSYSLIGNISQAPTQTEAASFSPDANGNLTGNSTIGAINPKFGPLVFNGGPTMTHALLPVSPALDAGNPAAVAGTNGVPEFDQRGLPWGRIVDGDEAGGPRIDMGAVERQANPLAGDYNFNGVVDSADYVVWRKTVDSANDFRADGDGDSDVDDADYVVWRSNFGDVWTPPMMTAFVVSSQPPALPGVSRAVRSELPNSATALFDSSETPAKPGAAGVSVESKSKVQFIAARRDDALLAWLTTNDDRRIERDDLPDDAPDKSAQSATAEPLGGAFDIALANWESEL